MLWNTSARRRGGFVVASALALLPAFSFATDPKFVNFETGQVRPLAMSPDGTRVFAVNTPDGRLEILNVTADGLAPAGSVAVGLEPVAVAARNDAEVWVVNHLSDSISIVDVSADPPRVVHTIQTCDEPRDIVFAGPGGNRAFVTTARRGQNCPVAANLTTPGLGRAVVQVWDASNVGNGLRGAPIANLELFADTPRALARSADGNTVYAAAFQSGNESTSITEGAVCDGGAAASPCDVFGITAPGGLPAPNVNVENVTGPEVGLIVRKNPADGKWEDGVGRDWSPLVSFDLPDTDVFAIDASATVPAQTAAFAHVGTVLFNMAINPATGALYVTNTEARNEVRFEGPGLAFNSTTVQGHQHEARITVIDPSAPAVTPRHLNKHIDYSERPAPAGVKERSLATPLGMAVTQDGTTLYVAAFGSDRIGVFDTAALADDSFVPDANAQIPVDGGGPTGILLDETRQRLYVLTRFDDAVAVIDLATRTESARVALHDPEPPVVRDGRPFLYDARLTSSNGEASCSSCHVFGDFDSLAWDLGNPDDVVLNNPLPFRIPPLAGTFRDFHPLKGPMTTQSLRGLANAGSMHWRGDRTGGNDPGGDVFDEDAAFRKFNVAFPGLVGRDTQLTDDEMEAFAQFALTITYPPNPIRNLDQTLTNQQQQGQDLFFGPVTDALFKCAGCHHLDPSLGFFGTDGFGTFEGETQMFKVAHLRNAYQKVGMFGRPQDDFGGPQVRGFGFLHDGSVDSVFHFLGASVFTLTNAQQRRLEQFVLAFDSNEAPIVGQQVTLDAVNATNVGTRLDLLIARAGLGECDIIVKGVVDGDARGAWRKPDGTFQLDRRDDPPLADADLRALTAVDGQALTYTCVPPGTGERTGVDRDADGAYDRDELDAGTDPSDPDSVPIAPTLVGTSTFRIANPGTAPFDPDRYKVTFRSAVDHDAPALPAWDGDGDPTHTGATLRLYRADGTHADPPIPLPAERWTRSGSAAHPTYQYLDLSRRSGPIRMVRIKNGRIDVSGRGGQVYHLDDAPQGAMALRLRLGDGAELCTVASAQSPATRNDTATRFAGAKGAAPTSCPRTVR